MKNIVLRKLFLQQNVGCYPDVENHFFDNVDHFFDNAVAVVHSFDNFAFLS